MKFCSPGWPTGLHFPVSLAVKWSCGWILANGTWGERTTFTSKPWNLKLVCPSICCLVALFCDPMDCSLPGSSVYGISPGKNTGVGCIFLLQGIFSTQGPNPGLLHWQADSLPLSHQGSWSVLFPNSSWLRWKLCIKDYWPGFLNNCRNNAKLCMQPSECRVPKNSKER